MSCARDTPDRDLDLDQAHFLPESSVTSSDDRVLPPCTPSKILCTHINYRSRWHEQGRTTPPKSPTYFQKPVTALNCHGGELVRPKGYKYLNYEGELAAIIGRVTRNVRPEDVWDRLAGFAVADIMTMHGWSYQKARNLVARGLADLRCALVVKGIHA